MVNFAKVDVKEVESDRLRSDFSQRNIEQLADLILESGGILRPLILKQVDIEKYIVLDGHLEYFASVRAREKDPRKGEMVNAFVTASKDEIAIQKQIQILGSHLPTNGIDEPTLKVSESKIQSQSSDWIGSFETRLSEVREELFQAKRDYEYRFVQLEKNFQEKKQIDLLDMINSLEKQGLIEQLSRCGMAKAKIEAIYDARNQKESKKFDDYQDIEKTTKGLGSSGILRLIDAWERIHKAKT
jgi:hypothetical protein